LETIWNLISLTEEGQFNMIIDLHKAESHSGEAMQMTDPYLVTNRQMR